MSAHTECLEYEKESKRVKRGELLRVENYQAENESVKDVVGEVDEDVGFGNPKTVEQEVKLGEVGKEREGNFE